MMKISDMIFVSKIGKGSFGNVWLAEYKNHKYAIKIYDMEKIKKNEDDFREAIELAKTLKHDNLVKCYGFKCELECYSILEYIKGYNLSVIPNISVKIKKYLPEIIEGLKAIHKAGFVHRDIKPDNIMIMNDKVKIIDYDFLRKVGDKKLSRTGTPLFVSPECYLDLPIDYPVDLWSLGVTLYVCLVKQYPYNAENRESLKKLVLGNFKPNFNVITSQFRQIVTGLLEIDPKKRLTLNEINLIL